MGRTLLITIEILAASIWIGSMVSLVVVSNISKRVLEPSSRVQLFRGVGRAYGIVGSCALLIAIAAGVAIAGAPSNWTRPTTAAVVLSMVLVILTAIGVAQARRMTVVRRRALASPGDTDAADAMRRGAKLAAIVRTTMGICTLVIVVLVASELA